MDVVEARTVLGLGATPTWDEVRVAYRARITVAHPDRGGGDAALAAVVNDAYTTLLRARRDGSLHRSRPGATTTTAHDARPARRQPDQSPPAHWEPPEVLDGATIRLRLPPDDAFRRLIDAAEQIGDLTYVDRSCAIFEALVAIEGEGTCSLVVTLQARGPVTEAFCTLEAIEHVGSPPVRPVVQALVAAMTPRGFTDP